MNSTLSRRLDSWLRFWEHRAMKRFALALLVLGTLAPSAQAHSPRGEQRLLVMFVEHSHPAAPNCPAQETRMPTCPRRTVDVYDGVVRNALNSFYPPDSYGHVRWTVRTVANPNTANGWWPAPFAYSRYATPAFVGERFVQDVAETTLVQAIREGVIRWDEVMTYDRFVVIDNHQVAAGRATAATLSVDLTAGRTPSARRWQPSYAWSTEGPTDAVGMSTLRHELGHQLGLPDLYSDGPCPFVPPGGIPTPTGLDDPQADCMGSWDLMAIDGRAGTGASMKIRLGWLDDRDPNQVLYLPITHRGSLEIDKLTRPLGRPVVVRLSRFPLLDELVRAFGGFPDAFDGFQVECRRRELGDAGLPGQGAFVTYIRSPGRPEQVVGRMAAGQPTNDVILDSPGDTYSTTDGISITYTGQGQDGSCRLSINRPPPDPNPAFMPDTTNFALLSELAGGSQSVSAFATGLGGTSGKGSIAQRRRRAPALRRGRPVSYTFRYGNAGAGAGSGTATVRVTEPYLVEETCGARPSRIGRMIKRIKLPSLRPGAIGQRTVRFRPRTRSANAGISVHFAGTDKVAQSAIALRTLRRGGSRVLRMRVRAGRACPGAVEFRAAPLTLPKGWIVNTDRARARVAPGRSATLRVKVRAPRSRSALSIPIAVFAGGPAATGVDPPPSYGAIGGFDLLLRTQQAGSAPPAFVIGPEAERPAVQPYPTAPTPTPAPPIPTPGPSPTPSPTPLEESILTLDCVVNGYTTGNEYIWTGKITPPHTGADVRITYLREGDEPIVQTAKTDADARFADPFTFGKPGKWQITAVWDGDADTAGDVSDTCAVLVDPP
jgi:hypothetical protein